MNISEKGLNLVKEFEGCYLNAYKCPAGVWTIGYGHTGSVDNKKIVLGMKITSAKATELLKADMNQHEKYVEKYVPFTLNQNQFDALVSFCFNCGPGNLQKLVKGRDVSEVADALLLYNKANGKELAGLTRRRKAERTLYNTPVKNDASSYYKKYSGKSISLVDALSEIGVKDTSLAARRKIAVANGIKSYTGKASENTKLLGLLKTGKLKK